MDSYNFHFERMSNLDLHPLSLPVSRLSPAKSSSSIVDQLTNHHHQHGKGDSAYSSFSGGSTAPDYPSPFLPDDLQPSSLHHYADLKYVKAIYHPHQLLQSDSKSMDQLYRSVEAISQQYRHNNSHHKSHDDNDDGCHGNNNPFCSQDVTPVAPSPAPPLPPPPPARLDSFIATRNLENTRAHHLGTETQRQPQPQQLSRPQSANTDPGSSDLRADLIYGGCWSSQKQPQPQPPPSYHSHHHKPQSLTPDHLFIADNTAAGEQQQKPVNIRLPPPGTSQPEHQKHRRAASSGGGNGSHGDGGFEGQRKRANSAHRCPGPEPSQSVSLWNASQNLINSSIQHKGQFYFITGVCKSTESNGKTHVYPSSEAGSESPATAETRRLREREREREKEREKERCHSTMDHLFKPLQQRPHSSDDKIADESETFFTPLTQGQELASSKLQEQENHGVISNKPSTQSSRGFDALEQIPSSQSREMGRHTANHHIFYCGPAESTAQTKEAAPLSVASEQSNHYKREREEPVKRGRRQPLGDVASERINKETTPMLYHLTGAGRAPLKVSKKDIDFSMKAKEAGHNKTGHNKDAAGRNERATAAQVEAPKEGRGESGLHLCNTLDDSFKKYYKEKLKDAQSKVLRETSFKRRDLQLSWPHRIRPRPEVRPTVILHSFSSSQDSETSTETLAPSVTSEGTEEAESVKEDVVEKEKESEKENGRPANVAQPQVPRIGGRKRLTAEQKKMCFSEPEKLNQLGHGPNHSTCRSLGDEMENFFTTGSKGEDAAEQGEQGLVAARRRMFETRGRALSASNLSKTNLKHLQHKALVEYMERKTGQKVAEPQQPGPQLLPAPYSQRHSIGGKTSDSGPKRKHPRPHSAGRILDSSSSSIRYAQFFSAQSSSVQSGVYPPEPSWSERQGSSQVKSASAESLLDQPEPPSFFRNRSTSTPHAFQARGQDKDPSPVITMGTSSLQKKAEEASPVGPAPEGQQRARAVAQRGKSMEELGVSKVTRNPALSKSSEQLDRLWSRLSRPGVIPGTPDGEKRRDEGRRGETRTRGQEAERKRKDQRGLEVMENAGQERPQAQVETLLRQDSAGTPGSEEDAGPPATTATGDLSRSTSPASSSSSRARALSAPGPFADEVRLSRPSSEASTPPSPSGPETGEGELKSTTSSPSLPRPASRIRSSPLVTASEREQSVDEPGGGEATPPDSSQEVSLSRGVTTDPSLWILPPEGGGDEEELQTPLPPDDVPEGESTSPAPPAQSSEPPASPSDPVPDADQSGGQERDVEDDEGNASGDGQKTEERRGPEGETESSEKTQPGEEPRWEELVEEVVRADPSLARALYPLTNRKTALMLMEQLLSEDTLLMEEHYKKKQEQRGASESSETVEDAEPSPCPSASDSQTPCAPEIHCKADVTEKKRILVSRIKERFRALEETRRALQAEIQENVVRGEEVEALVRERCLPVELERYSLFIGDLERVVSLLLCLSARLARVQNALSTVDQYTDAEEMESLDNRHRLLCKQRDDAKDLKDNLDRRESVVSSFLSRQLSGEQLRFYRRFVQTKASLLIRQKDLEERQRLGEEQLEALQSGLPP